MPRVPAWLLLAWRGADSNSLVLDSPPLVEALALDPVLRHRKLIAYIGDNSLLPRSGERGFPHWGVWMQVRRPFPQQAIASPERMHAASTVHSLQCPERRCMLLGRNNGLSSFDVGALPAKKHKPRISCSVTSRAAASAPAADSWACCSGERGLLENCD